MGFESKVSSIKRDASLCVGDPECTLLCAQAVIENLALPGEISDHRDELEEILEHAKQGLTFEIRCTKCGKNCQCGVMSVVGPGPRRYPLYRTEIPY